MASLKTFILQISVRPANRKKSKQKGQALVEYILLLAMVMILSLVLIKFANAGLANYWLYIVKKITYPTIGVDFN